MNIIKYIGITVIGISLFSCDKNDTVLDLGDPVSIVPEVYMDNLDPVFAAGETIEAPIVYWLESKKFGDFLMNHSYDSVATVKINSVAGVNYLYEKEVSGEIMEQETYKTESHDPANWTPTEYVYTFKSKYSVDSNLGKKKVSQADASQEEFAAMLNNEFYSVFYKDLATGMGKEKLQILIVDTYAIVDQTEFDTYFDVEDNLLVIIDEEGNKDFYGQSKVIEALAVIPQEDLMGSRYSLVMKTKVVLQYWIKTRDGKYKGESAYRSFTVK